MDRELIYLGKKHRKSSFEKREEANIFHKILGENLTQSHSIDKKESADELAAHTHNFFCDKSKR